VKIPKSLRFTGLERRGSDKELSQVVVQIVHLESVTVYSDGREIRMRLGKDEG
jgi:hypothetical protein